MQKLMNHLPWRPRKISSDKQLCEQFVAYAEKVEANPVSEETVIKTKNGFLHITLTKPRAMSIMAFCLHLGVTTQAWRYWRKNREDISEAIERIEGAIYSQQFEGAAAGIFKANIISRELGLSRNT